MSDMPRELVFGEIYYPPLLLVLLIAYALSMASSYCLARVGLYKYVALPVVVEICLVILFTGLLGQVIPVF